MRVYKERLHLVCALSLKQSKYVDILRELHKIQFMGNVCSNACQWCAHGADANQSNDELLTLIKKGYAHRCISVDVNMYLAHRCFIVVEKTGGRTRLLVSEKQGHAELVDKDEQEVARIIDDVQGSSTTYKDAAGKTALTHRSDLSCYVFSWDELLSHREVLKGLRGACNGSHISMVCVMTPEQIHAMGEETMAGDSEVHRFGYSKTPLESRTVGEKSPLSLVSVSLTSVVQGGKEDTASVTHCVIAKCVRFDQSSFRLITNGKGDFMIYEPSSATWCIYKKLSEAQQKELVAQFLDGQIALQDSATRTMDSGVMICDENGAVFGTTQNMDTDNMDALIAISSQNVACYVPPATCIDSSLFKHYASAWVTDAKFNKVIDLACPIRNMDQLKEDDNQQAVSDAVTRWMCA